MNTITASNAIGGKKAGAEGDDPIEYSLNLRIKAGGVNEVVPADKKAVGVTKPPGTKPSTTTIGKPPKEEKKEEKKVPSITATKTVPKDTPSEGIKPKKSSSTLPTTTLSSAPKVMKGKKKNEEEKK